MRRPLRGTASSATRPKRFKTFKEYNDFMDAIEKQEKEEEEEMKMFEEQERNAMSFQYQGVIDAVMNTGIVERLISLKNEVSATNGLRSTMQSVISHFINIGLTDVDELVNKAYDIARAVEEKIQ